MTHINVKQPGITVVELLTTSSQLLLSCFRSKARIVDHEEELWFFRHGMRSRRIQKIVAKDSDTLRPSAQAGTSSHQSIE